MKNVIQSRLGLTRVLVTLQCLRVEYSAQKQNGFTLIELLVVVLIIGILATVALPQYQTAVLKSRLSAALPMLKTFKQAAEAYYIANGEYTNDVRVYDIGLCKDRSAVGYCRVNEELVYDVNTALSVCSDSSDIGTYIFDKNGVPVNNYIICLENSKSSNYTYCGANKDNSPANHVCKSMSANGTVAFTKRCWYSADARCNYYRIDK